MSTDMNSNILYLLSFHEEWKIDDSALNKTLNASTQTVEFRCSIDCIKNLSKKTRIQKQRYTELQKKKSVIDELKQVLKEKKILCFRVKTSR